MLITYIVIYLYIGYMHYQEIVFSSLLWFRIFSFSLNIGTAGLSTILITVLPLLSIEANEIIDYYPPPTFNATFNTLKKNEIKLLSKNVLQKRYGIDSISQWHSTCKNTSHNCTSFSEKGRKLRHSTAFS